MCSIYDGLPCSFHLSKYCIIHHLKDTILKGYHDQDDRIHSANFLHINSSIILKDIRFFLKKKKRKDHSWFSLLNFTHPELLVKEQHKWMDQVGRTRFEQRRLGTWIDFFFLGGGVFLFCYVFFPSFSDRVVPLASFRTQQLCHHKIWIL